MARPLKTGLDYFPLSVNEFSDEKYMAISGEFGLKGEIAMIKLHCILYDKGYYLKWEPMVRSKLIHQTGGQFTKDEMDAFIASSIEYQFFDRSIFENHQILTSRKIQENYEYAVSRRRGKPECKDYWLLDDGNPKVDQEGSEEGE